MLGAIVGDIVGSVYEWNNIRTKEFEFFREDCFFTDDTVMTIATAEAVMNGGGKDDFIDAYKKWGRRYPTAGFGGRFAGWLASEDREPYMSWGNGDGDFLESLLCRETFIRLRGAVDARATEG